MNRRVLWVALAIALPLALVVPLQNARSRQPRVLELKSRASITLGGRDLSGFFWRDNGLFLTRTDVPLQKGPLPIRGRDGEIIIVRAAQADEASLDQSGHNAALIYRRSMRLEHDLWDIEAGVSRGVIVGLKGAEKLQHNSPYADQWTISPDGQRAAWKAPATQSVQIGATATARADANFVTSVASFDVDALAFSPDSRQLAIYSRAKMWIVDARNGQLKRQWALNPRDNGDHTQWSPDGKYLAIFWGHPYTFIIKPRVNPPRTVVFLRVFDAQTGKLLRSWSQTKSRIQPEGVASVAFSPDGQTLAFGSFDGDALLMNLQTGQIERHLPAASAQSLGDPAHFVAYSPDGQTLAVATQNRIMLWRAR